ncbi:hypothetical protein CU103_21045 [Phyllobacterium sophorae]|uniref:Uncharacterized protein n=1 Tax=Phyllobacterium sophorae TaxID=1520277 RepID=A0A2P7B5R3_9HYPH|nr:hypothetical protein CU103_21045 [Phyllobacterium sophorae]
MQSDGLQSQNSYQNCQYNLSPIPLDTRLDTTGKTIIVVVQIIICREIFIWDWKILGWWAKQAR